MIAPGLNPGAARTDYAVFRRAPVRTASNSWMTCRALAAAAGDVLDQEGAVHQARPRHVPGGHAVGAQLLHKELTLALQRVELRCGDHRRR
ncbi:hypothetical protein GCM10029963_05060 [Micromonospora andamanensis]